VDDTNLDYDSEDGMEDDVERAVEEHENLNLDYGSWQPNRKNRVLEKNGQRLKLKHNDSFSLVGECRLIVLQGVISLRGAILTAGSEHWLVTAPVIEPLPVIKCLSSDGAELFLHHIEQESYRSLSKLSHLFNDLFGKASFNNDINQESTFKIVSPSRYH
jgi:hypothetical protein